ncbi:ZZ type Zinc finger containing protein [Sporothrix schenckii 1099-18]|uniref:ZZ type Zinc finger containing protein n=1 Tax=Sporothrix schenckii 1099-18 TaxID=1397361 RepID=A0A0F2M4E8_SPOSC|nr:ZZ type Zinc finger containing protein [Sporothrix schenckii 1099-18]KJR84588.1 ZZ type Zinc finger containing protein [Sporothrix schenckii 1099-18]
MPPSMPIQPDTPIAVKIAVEDDVKAHKKTKIPYGVLADGLPALEQKVLREFLAVPERTPCHFERFSDSAGKNIPLVSTNPAAYRQLLRAAKAKQKLKLRAVFHETESATPEQTESEGAAKSTGPRPVTIEDIPEAAPNASSTPAATIAGPAPTPAAPSAEASTTLGSVPATATASAVASATVSAIPIASSSKASLKSAFAALTEFKEKPHELTPDVVQRCIDAYPDIPGHFPEGQTETEWEKELDERYQATMRSMAQNHQSRQDLADRNLAIVEATIAQMNLNSNTSGKQPGPIPPQSSYYHDPFSTFTFPTRTPVNPLAGPSTSATSNEAQKPKPIPVAKYTRDYPSTWAHSNSSATIASPTPNLATKATPPVATCATVTAPRAAFTVCCNSCERKIPDAHYHCSTCEGGDFDLCETCIELGITCYNPEHWMIRRNIQNNLIVNSTTERISPKAKPASSATTSEKAADKAPMTSTEKVPAVASVAKDVKPTTATTDDAARTKAFRKYQIRTCNNCIRELPEFEFLHCSECFDFDLCKACFVKNDHGHHPKHAFQPAVKGTEFGWNVTRRLSAGRGYRHNAVCDGCEAFITGVRHKCSDCPDWDYCSDCVLNAGFIHPDHRFIPIYEPLAEAVMTKEDDQVIHNGIFCDGPHCASNGLFHTPIRGNRYKCAVCDNKDFCATCEASPSNTHNKTHPLIKFRTPVRHVLVTTTGEHDNGRRMPTMGDRRPKMFTSLGNRPVSTPAAETSSLSANKVQTVLDMEPSAAPANTPATSADLVAKEEIKKEEVTKEKTVQEEPEAKLARNLGAGFKAETVSDGTSFAPNQTFEQTWTMRNTGSVSWPAGCRVTFVGGDYMGHVDPNSPAGIQELVSSSESTICYKSLAPGEEASFTILLRSPSRLGRIISYWRLTTKGGIKFGDRLWCDINVRAKEDVETKADSTEKTGEEVEKSEPKADEKSEAASESQMIFPKLETESPVDSIHEAVESALAKETTALDFEDEEDWTVENSDDGFLTDEEYDILDASDEESLVGEDTKARK